MQKNQTRSIFDSHQSNLENNLHKIAFLITGIKFFRGWD